MARHDPDHFLLPGAVGNLDNINTFGKRRLQQIQLIGMIIATYLELCT